MLIKIPKVIIGSDLTGMLVAAKEDAMFIPVSFCEPFAWEFTKHQIPFVDQMRNIFLVQKENKYITQQMLDEQFLIKTKKNGKIEEESIPAFLWEVQKFYEFLFLFSNNLWRDYSFNSCTLELGNILKFRGNGSGLSVEFKHLTVINPSNSWFQSDVLEKEGSEEADIAHLLYFCRFETEKHADMKGIQVDCDLEFVDHPLIDKIWFNRPFGKRLYQFGNNPRTKKKIKTTKRLLAIKQNVPIELINDEQFSAGKARAAIFEILAPRFKRIKEHGLSFERFVKKMVLSEQRDVFKDTENVKFIMFDDKSEIICPNFLDSDGWQDSFLHILLKSIKWSTHLVLTNSFPLKSRF